MKFHVENALINDTKTPILDRKKPDASTCEPAPDLTALANDNITKDITVNTICIHQATQLQRASNLFIPIIKGELYASVGTESDGAAGGVICSANRLLFSIMSYILDRLLRLTVLSLCVIVRSFKRGNCRLYNESIEIKKDNASR